MMLRYLVPFIFSLFISPVFPNTLSKDAKEKIILSTPEQAATLSCESSYLIGGLISPLSGLPCLKQTDCVVKGAQDIVFSRIYIAPYMPTSFPKYPHNQSEWDKYNLYHHLEYNYKGWQFYPHLKLRLNPLTLEVLVTDPNGMTLNYRLTGPNFSIASLVSPPYALSNTSGDIPSGKYDPRNIRISHEDKFHKISVHAADGAIRFYYANGLTEDNQRLFILAKEILPNGKILRYHYNKNVQLDSIESLDPKERFVYASIRINGSPWDGNCQFTSSSGLTASYSYEKKKIEAKFKGKQKHWYGNDTYNHKYQFTCPPLLTSVNSPNYRHETSNFNGQFLLDAYSGKNDIFNTSHIGCGERAPHYRVNLLSFPVGPNDASQPVYELSYQPPIAGQKEGNTTVKNSDGTSAIYHFSKNLLTTLIQYFGQDGLLKKEKVFSWDERNWLKAFEMRDGQKNILYKYTYEYDRFGNPNIEIFSGNLSGEGNQETFETKRTFSEDGRNLLLREESEDGKVVCYSYVLNTNLVTSKLIKDRDRVTLREFAVYDDCNNLIQRISDDGSGESKDDLSDISQRTITTYTLRQSAPFLHMPEWIEETYWEAGIEKPLTKSHLIYDQHGYVAQEEVYDAEGKHSYTICKTYNERGDVLAETNRLGQKATYTYDPRGRPDTSLNFSNKVEKTFRHDKKGRLRELTEKGNDGIVHISAYEYDFHDRKKQKRDPFQNVTLYTYDPLVSQISKTEYPPIASINGQAARVISFSSYDPFGREATNTDYNGHTTTYQYNAYGSPVAITHPDGSREYFRYTKKGTLASHTDQDGLTTQYIHDVLGRVLSKTFISADEETLAEETFTYNGFNPLTETDKEGNVRKYSYDGAGRKIREEFCERATDFGYDALGWLATVRKNNGDNTLLIHYKRDLEGRILKEYKANNSEQTLYKISYSYDKDGNKETITRYIDGKEAVDSFVYDSDCRLIEKKDAEGHVTRTTYNENYTNSLGQKVLQTAITDPRQITIIQIKDALDRIVKKETLNPQKAPISCHELIHDAQGNLLYQTDYVYENDRFHNTQTIKHTYTPSDQVASLTRGLGTKDERTTTYTYFPSGKIQTKTLPDGITLTYSYHPLGFMSRLDSSDDRIHHAFEYDRLGYLKLALDEIQNIAIQRDVDPFGNVKQEIFPNGFEITKSYDDFNRLISLNMSNVGGVLYTYDPIFLRKVTRVSNTGMSLYSHVYESYDLNGNLLSEQLIGNLGNVVHAVDLKGQKVSISSPYFSQQCKYDSVGNLFSNVVDGIDHHYFYDGLSQLFSEKGPGQSCTYAYDSLYNRIQKNGANQKINDLNELLSLENTFCSYDLNGNLEQKKSFSENTFFSYDPLNRLIEVTSEKKKINFVYDPLGRRLSKVVYAAALQGWGKMDQEHYLYDGQNEIGAFATSGSPKNLRVLGIAKHKNNPVTVGVELEGQISASLIDVQGNIRRLVDLRTRVPAGSHDFTVFGVELGEKAKENNLNPWRFASKRFDPELGLIFFGKRYYDPFVGRWLTVDPAGFVDSVNLYQYVLNNPFRYVDPNGEFVITIPFLIWGAEIVITSTWVAPVVYGAITGVLAFGAYKGVQALNKNTEVYVPDRALPRDENGVLIPDTDAPHTQLGTKEGSKGKYPQAREFDEDGSPVKDIDFTDHGRPDKHPNPHQHKYEPNPTGGTPGRSKNPQPVPQWDYK